MPSSRLSLRLGQLPHEVLAELAARLCSESPALQAAAEECMAAQKPLSHELVERVLLSPDLVPSILGPLETEDGAAAAVCKQWLVGWKATNEPRRRLKQVPLDLPEEIDTRNYLEMTATLDGRLVVREGLTVHILDRSMRVLQRVAGVWNSGRVIAADDDSIFSIADDTTLRRSTYDGTVVAEFELEGYPFQHGVLSPGGLLFSVLFDREVGGADEDEIVALDAKTLQLRHRFGLGLLNDAQQLAVAGDELYVCDTNTNRLQVFSLTGEHRRSITGAWRSPLRLCSAKDRLYLVEKSDGRAEDDDHDDGGDQVQAHRLLVLSLQGEILQVVTHPTEPTAVFNSSLHSRILCCVNGKLLASYWYWEPCPHYDGAMVSKNAILALQGL